MNWLLIIVIAILGGAALKGRYDGFIKTVFSIFSVLIALALTASINPYIGKEIQKNEKVTSFVSEKVSEVLEIKKEEDGVADQVKAIDQLELPKSLKNALVENNNADVYKVLVVNKFEQYVSRYLAAIIINGICFLLVFAIVMILLQAIYKALDLFSKLPIINGLNKTAGLFVGFFKGLIVIWILFLALTVISGTSWGKIGYAYINDSVFLSSLYNNNLLLQLITNIAKMLV